MAGRNYDTEIGRAGGGPDAPVLMPAGAGAGAGAGSGGSGWFTPGENRNELKGGFSVGEIPDNIQRFESLGEAYHDFSASNRTMGAIIKDKVLFINRIMKQDYSTNEEKTAELIHNAFNNGENKGNLRLDKTATYKTYENPAELDTDLFTGDNVNPLLFMVKPEDLRDGTFTELFDKLKRILHAKYGLEYISIDGNVKLGVSDDSYEHHTDGNPIDLYRILSAASFFDPATTGVSEAGVKAAKTEGRFIEGLDISGQSFWGIYHFKSNRRSGNYDGATLSLKLKGDTNDREIILNIPPTLRHGLSVYDLSVIYDKIKSFGVNITHVQRKTIITELLINLRQRHPNMMGNPIDLFFTQIISHAIDLYNDSDKIIPDLLLEFIFLLKELGDMLTHKVAVKYGHLAGASPDRLSTIGFLKRGTPLTYMRIKPGQLPRILFRSLGTLHIQGRGMSRDDVERQQAEAKARADALQKQKEERQAEKQAKAKEAALRKKAERDQALLRAKREAEEKRRRIIAERERRASARAGGGAGGGGGDGGGAGGGAGGAGRYSPNPLIRPRSNSDTEHQDRRTRAQSFFPGGLVQGVRNLRRLRNSKVSKNEKGNLFRSINNQRKSLSKRRQNDYRNKTFKQRGGGLTLESIDELVNLKIKSVIDGVFNNLNRVLLSISSPTVEPTALFNIVAVDEFNDEINTDLTEGEVFVDNKLLGLPLATILYVLYDNLYELPIEDYDNNETLERSMNIIIKDFLIGYNFEDSDIECIMNDPIYTITDEKIRVLLLILAPPAATVVPSSQPGSGMHTPGSQSTANDSLKSLLASPAGAHARETGAGAGAGARDLSRALGDATEPRPATKQLRFNNKTPRKSRKNSTLRKRRI